MSIGNDPVNSLELLEMSPPDAAGRATRRVLRITAILWAAAWFLTLVATFAADPSAASNPLLILLALGVLAVSWLVITFARAVPSWQFVVCVGATALVAVGNVRTEALPEAALLLTTWVNLGTITAALLLPRWVAPIAIWALSLTAFALLGTRLLLGPVNVAADRTALMMLAYAICVGMAVWVGTSALYRAATDADDEAARARRALSDEASAVAHHDEVARMSRLLHDTCINTLGAIRYGWGLQHPDTIRERCAADLSTVDEAREDTFRSASTSFADLTVSMHEAARIVGVSVAVTSSGPATATIDPAISRAATGATREALLNVAKYATFPRAAVELTLNSDGLTIAVTDDGPGWSGDYPAGGGIDRSIRERLQLSGGSMSLDIGPQGSRILLRWPPEPMSLGSSPLITRHGPQGAVEVPDSIAAAGLRGVVLGAGSWMLAYSVIATLAFIGAAPLSNALLALSILGGSLAAVARSKRTAIPRWLSPIIAVGIAVVVALPGNTGACLTTTPAAWGPDGAAVLVLIVCMLVLGWSGPLWAIAGFALGLGLPLVALDTAGDNCVATSVTVLAIEIGTVLVIYAVGALLRRTWAMAAAFRSRSNVAQAAAAEADARDRARSARLRWTVSRAGDLLRRIAEGDLDPADPEVRGEAGEMEAALRSLLTLDAALGPLGDLIAESITDAMDSGRRLEVRSGGPVPIPTTAQLSDLGRVFAATINWTPVGTAIPIALFTERGMGMLTIVVPTPTSRPALLPAELIEGPLTSGLVLSLRDLDTECLVLATWVGNTGYPEPVSTGETWHRPEDQRTR